MRKYLFPIDLVQNEIRNAVIQNLGSDPSSPAPINGQIWYLTTGGHDVRARVNGANVSLVPTSLLAGTNAWTAANTFSGGLVANSAVTGSGTVNLTGTGASSVGGTMGATAFVPTGLAGSTAASRYVGATASGAPTTGAHLAGDYAVAQDGHIWVCTAPGTPGTWQDVAGSGFPGYGAVTAQTAFGAASSNGVATTVPRSDHVHGTPTHTITDHSAFRLDQFAAPNVDLSIGSHKLINVLDPTAAQDAATKAYVDNARAGLSMKDPVRVATTTNGALATAYANGQVVDGVTLATGDRILLKNQTTASENGIYVVAASGAPARAGDADVTGEIVVGTGVWVQAGTANGNQRWVATATTATPWVPNSSGSTWTLDFAATSITAGAGLTASGGVLAVGAGTGISVAADTVGVDTSLVARWKTGLIGNGVATSIAFNHALGNQWVHVQVFEVATLAQVEVDVVLTDANNVTLGFTTAPASNAYRVVVVG